MKEFLRYLLENIVSHPDELKITEETQGGEHVFKISVAQEDMGTVIGKNGRIIQSIREMAKTKAIKDKIKVDVVIEEKNQ